MTSAMHDLEVTEKLLSCVKRQSEFMKAVLDGDVVKVVMAYNEEALLHISDLIDSIDSIEYKADMELAMAKTKVEIRDAFEAISKMESNRDFFSD